MLNEVLAHLHNYFVTETKFDTYEVKDGCLELDFVQEDQYFRIIGSVFNDGVYQYPCTDLKDEVFNGSIQALAIPQDLIKLVNEIQDFCEKPENNSPTYTSESWGGYSYTRAVDANGQPAGWKTVFSKRLNRWRKI